MRHGGTRPKFYTSVQPGGRSVEDGKRDILGELAAKFLHFYPGHKLDDLWDIDIRNITALLAQALLLRGERMADEASVMRLAIASALGGEKGAEAFNLAVRAMQNKKFVTRKQMLIEAERRLKEMQHG